MTTITLNLPGICATFDLPLDVEQVDSMDAAEHMTASGLAVGADGWALTLVHGVFRYLPDVWREWWSTAGFDPCDGLRALAVLRLFSVWEATRKRHRGEHGPPAAGADLHRLLLSAALAALGRGMSYRAAAAYAIDEHSPQSGRKAEESLLRRLTRHLKKGR